MAAPGALYVGGNRTAGRYTMLPVALSFSDRQSKTYITPKAVQQAQRQGPVYEVSAEKVIAGESSAPLHFLLFRHQIRSPYKLYLSDAELNHLSEFFEVPTAVLEGAFFSLRQGFSLEHRQIEVAPRWQELLNPKWAGAFKKWLSAPAKYRLPNPSRIPWVTSPAGIIIMPALRSVGYVDKWKEKNMSPIGGELEFGLSSTGIPQALFHYEEEAMPTGRQGKAKIETFLLEAGGVKHLAWFDATNTSDGIAPLTKPEFSRLFGNHPALLQYTCSREAGSKEMTLTTIRGEKIRLTLANGNKFEGGRTHFIRFVREGAALRVACYLDSKMTEKSLLGQGSITLYEGYPSVTTISI